MQDLFFENDITVMILIATVFILVMLCGISGYFLIKGRKQRDMYKHLLQKMKQGLVITDVSGRLREYNAVALEVFSQLKDMQIGAEFVKADELAELLNGQDEKRFQRGNACYCMKKYPIMGEDELIGYAIWIWDVTEIRAYTEELIRLKEEADYSNKEKSNFLANMSHEIRTPLNVIIGSTELILRENVTDTVLDNASTIKQSGQSLLGIINDILDFSKIEAGKMEIVSVNYSVESLITDLINMIIVRMGNKKLDFIVDVDVNLPAYLYGDDIRIKQIIINLLTNAVKFTETGHIILRVRQISRSEDGSTAVLRFDVEDSGIGIRKENLKNLYDSFSRFDTNKNRAIEGTGLGLAISLRLAKNMRGKLLVESEYGKGSCFSLEIPQGIASDEENVRTSCYSKALVLEKDEQYKKIYQEAFNYMDIDSTVTGTEEEFFELLNRSYDIVFVDKETYNSPLIIGLKADKVILLDKMETVRRRSEEDITVMKQGLVMKLRSILNRTYLKELRNHARASERKFIAPEARVLIVDDNAVNLKIATGLLKAYELQADVADSGKKAIAKLEENDYDIIFMDHMMPEMDGIETTARIRSRAGKKFQNVIIVALTANAVNGAKNIFMNSGMQDFLSKPIEMERMNQILKTWLPKDKLIEKQSDEEKCLNIRGFDKELGLAEFQGDEEQYEIALKVYFMMAERFMEEISANTKTKHWKAIETIAHTFVAESKKVGAVRFARFLEKYEKACKEQNETFILANYSFLNKGYEEIAEGLEKYLNK